MMESKCKQLALGALAGLAGTMILQAARGAQQKKLPRATPPIQRDPGEFMIKKVEQILPERARARISKGLESIGAMSLGIGYGTTFGSAYAALRRRPRNVLAEGAALGIASWAVGFLGWLPATGLMPPVSRHEPQQVAASIAEHALYGIAVVSAFKWLRRHL